MACGGFVIFEFYLLDSVGNFAGGRRGEGNYEENGAKIAQMAEIRGGWANFASVSFRGLSEFGRGKDSAFIDKIKCYTSWPSMFETLFFNCVC